MRKVPQWEEDFDTEVEDSAYFGHNIEVDKSVIKKLVRMSRYVEIVNHYMVRITLPPKAGDRERLLLYLLTNGTMPSQCTYNKNRDKLTVEWHY